MLFNSWIFIGVFLPIVLMGYYYMRHRLSYDIALSFLVLASLFFYGWWDMRYVLLLLASIFVNFSIGTLLSGQKWSLTKPKHKLKRKTILTAGVVGNLLALGYYKYAGFFVLTLNDMGAGLTVPEIVLPLAISFFTFQQIAYLVDAYQGKTKELNFRHYCLFVTFFPQLIAGPIVHHKEMLPQFMRKQAQKINWPLFTMGLVVFFIGLFKKVVIADRLAEVATPIFAAATQRAPLTFFESWIGALAYTFQLYFDFSGYSDMAVGIAALFGICLPLNFFSPYKARNISEFWKRWHMTLSRFLRDYLYIPLGGNRHGKTKKMRNLLITMVLGGLWHGANWTFVIWGALHGFYLVVYHGFAAFTASLSWTMPAFMKHPMRLLAWFITFIAVVVAWVFFRADHYETAVYMLQSMSGQFGVALWDPSQTLGTFLSSLGFDVAQSQSRFLRLGDKLYLLGAAFMIAIFMPSLHDFMGRKVALGTGDLTAEYLPKGRLRFKLHAGYVLMIGLMAAMALLSLTRVSEFLYFQF